MVWGLGFGLMFRPEGPCYIGKSAWTQRSHKIASLNSDY